MDNTDWIGQIYVSDFGWNALEDIVDIGPRLGASDGERRAHDRVLEALDSAGCRELSEHSFEVDHWQRGDANLATEKPYQKDLPCFALPGSPAGKLTSEFVHLGYGLPSAFEQAELEGKIAVVRSDVPEWYDHWMHRQEKYGLAIENGAVGFVFANHVEGSLAPTGSLGRGIEVMGQIPAVGVSKEVGERLARYASRGSVEGTLDVEARVEPGTSQNVMGLMGPSTDCEIIVCAHVDGHDISDAAIDNGAGVAIMLEVAHALGLDQQRLDTTVRFVGFGCEELGLVGSQHFAADRDLSNVRAVVNLDGIGLGREQKIYTNAFDDFRPVIDRVADEFGHPSEWIPEYMVHSDHWPFVWHGVPGAMVTAETGNKGRGFGHTTADTLDKVDIRNIRDHAILTTKFVEYLTRTEIERKKPEDIERDLEKQGRAKHLSLTGDWPY